MPFSRLASGLKAALHLLALAWVFELDDAANPALPIK
jgi:hypothetical protein